MRWTWTLCRIEILCVMWIIGGSDGKELNIDWQNVGTKKNKLIRRPISLQSSVMGEPANLCCPCNQDIYDKCVKPIYDGDSKLSIFERSDRLLALIKDVQHMHKYENVSSTCPEVAAGGDKVRFSWREICGSNHLMACINGECRCMGEAPTDYPVYATMKEAVFKDPTDPSKIYKECRVVEENAICNTLGLLFCDNSPERDPPLRCVTSGHRCRCREADPNDPTQYSQEYEDEAGLIIPKIPTDDCHPMVRKRYRQYQ